jgi:hypothetical protein
MAGSIRSTLAQPRFQCLKKKSSTCFGYHNDRLLISVWALKIIPWSAISAQLFSGYHWITILTAMLSHKALGTPKLAHKNPGIRKDPDNGDHGDRCGVPRGPWRKSVLSCRRPSFLSTERRLFLTRRTRRRRRRARSCQRLQPTKPPATRKTKMSCPLPGALPMTSSPARPR